MSVTTDQRIQAARLTVLPELDTLRDEWWQLEGRCPDLTPFSTWEWCRTVAKHYGGGRPLWVFTLRSDGDLVGIAPFAETRLGGLRLLRFIGSGLGHYSMADYQDLLTAEGHEDEVAAFCDELARQPEWDVLHLQELPSSSRTPAGLVAAAAAQGWLTELKPGSDVHLLCLDGTWDSYKATLSRSTRKGTAQKIRKLVAERAASFSVVVEDESAVRAAMEDLFDLHTRRWNSVGKPGIFSTQRRRRFDHELACRLAQRGMLRLFLLRSGDRTISVSYGFQRDGTEYHYGGGFDPAPEWNGFRLGMSLDLWIIEDSFRRGVRRIDFLRGSGHYKEHYRAETHFNQDLLVFRNRRARLHYRVARAARGALNRLRRRLADGRAKLRKVG